MRYPFGILGILAVLISTTQTITNAILNSETHKGRNGLQKTTETYFAVILRAVLNKEGIEKELYKFERIPQDLMQANDLLTKQEW